MGESQIVDGKRRLVRRSEEVVKMQDRLQMSPLAVMFRGKLLGKEKTRETEEEGDEEDRRKRCGRTREA